MSNPTEKADVKACLEACEKCIEICDKAAAEEARLTAPGRSKFGDLCADAADISRSTASFLRRESPETPRICALCAQICRLCADAAAPSAATSELHLLCAKACTFCADECALHAVERRAEGKKYSRGLASPGKPTQVSRRANPAAPPDPLSGRPQSEHAKVTFGR